MTEVSLLRKIANNFTELSERERLFMKEHFGIEMPRMPTLEEVQDAFEKTREKIREFERRATKAEHKPPTNDDPGSAPPSAPPGEA
jgi:DNA-directed RNA polymerase sigma subunit (sigma70/sigma32)